MTTLAFILHLLTAPMPPTLQAADCTTADQGPHWSTTCRQDGKVWLDVVSSPDGRGYYVRDHAGYWALDGVACASGAWDPSLQDCIPCAEARAEGWIMEDAKCEDNQTGE